MSPPKRSKNERTIKHLTNALLVLIVVFAIAYHYQGRQLADYENRFMALSVKSSQLYLETMRQKVDWLTVLAEHGIIDPLELETATNNYHQAMQREQRKREGWRSKYGY
ncbi:MAG: hypothetical protein QNK37_35200 [Acidobacteriota bacterium]|nr:hypothetical protein [Acidobacteriota bacterium]